MSRKKEYVLLVLLGVIILVAGGYLFRVWEDYHEASAGYQKLQKYIIERPDVEKGNERQPDNQEEPEESLPEIDFDGLRAVNEDIVAWIQIPGIGVDYPVVQGKNNEHYLHYTFEGWYYVKKKYKLKVNFSYNLPFFIQPIFPSYSISVHTHSRIHLVIDIHNDCGFLPYYKMSLCIQIPIYRHVHNFLF